MHTRFWYDWWLGNCPLKISFPNLFRITSNPDLEVNKALVDGQWSIEFRRQMNDSLLEEWNNLLELLSSVELTEGRDVVF
jgi:hypothetical protein